MATNPAYAKNRQPKKTTRVVVEIETDLLKAVDDWGIKTGKTSRRETVETLLRDRLAKIQEGAADAAR